MRADTFSTKEPEILKWIDENGSDSPFWDIGANIGLYSIYYALTQPGKVIAFEPSVFNLKQLAKNITLNDVSKKIDLIPIPLTNSNGFNDFSVSSLQEGSAQNAFGVDFGFDGKEIGDLVNYRVLGMTGDEVIQSGYAKQIPKLIKIDVDGIEHLILEGMRDILSSNECYSVFVEVNDDFEEQADNVNQILSNCGFMLSEKTHSEILDKSAKYSQTYNQIWFKT